MKKKSFNRIFHEILSFFLVVAIVAGTFYYSPKPVEAATYTFTQSGWTGGATANTASHTSNQTGWAQFSTSTSGLSAGSTITLATSTYYFTDDGTVSASGSATGGGFSNGTNSSTTVSGSGSGASVALASSTTYASSGVFESATIDLGTLNDLSTLTWNPSSQSASTSLWFEAAAKNTDSGWQASDYISLGSEAYPSGVTVEEWTIQEGAGAGTCNSTNRLCGSFSAWEDAADASGARDLVSENKIVVAKIDGAWTTADTASSVVIDGWTTNATHYVKIYTMPAARHNGKWDTTKYRLEPAVYAGPGCGDSVIKISEPYVRIDGLQIRYTNTACYAGNGIYIVNPVDDVRISSNIVRYSGTSTSYTGIYAENGANTNVRIWNNIIYDFQGGIGIEGIGDGTVSGYVYNNTVFNCSGTGFYTQYISTIAKNNIAQNCADGFAAYFAAGSDYNISDLASDAPGANSKNSTTVSFIATSTKDFHLASSDTAAKNAGSDLSNDAYLPFNTDVDGRLRSGTWDIGADEEGVTALPTTGYIPSNFDNMRYIRYKAYLRTNDTNFTPQLNDVTVNYSGYPPSATLTSSKYDTLSDSNLISKINWTASATSTTETVRFQVRSASSSAGLDSATWCGYGDCSGSTYFTDANNNQALASGHSLRSGGDDRWFQYRVLMGSGGSAAPVLSQVVVTYVINASPDFNSSYGTGGVSASQVSDGSADYDNDASVDQGKVLLIYSARDQDSLSGSTNPGQISPSFEYRLTSTSSWTSISSGYLNTGALNLKSVSETNYTSTSTAVTATTTSALWNASAQLGTNVYSTTVQLRITANDNEGANNTAVATSSAFTLDTKPPTAAITVDSSGSSDAISYNFSDDSNIEYRISNNGGFSNDGNGKYSWQTVGATSTTASTTWTLTGSPSYETVYFQVRDLYGNATASSSDTAPLAPTNFYYKDISNPNTGDYREFLSWGLYVAASSSADFGSTRVYRSTDGSSYSQIASITDSAQNYYTNSGLSSSTTYYYKVLHIDSDGDISNFTSAISDKPDGQGGTDSTAPIISSVATSTVRSVSAVITWTTDEAASSTVQYSTAAAGDYASSVTVVSYVTSHSVTVSGLTPNTAYVFRVRSMDISGNEATATNGGAGYSFTTQGGPIVSGVSCPEVSDNSLTIIWNTNTDSNSEIEYSVNSGLSSSNSSSSAALVGSSAFAGGYYQHRIVLSGLSQSATYYYQVKSTDGSSNQTIDNNSGVYYTCKTTADAKPPVISNIQTPVRTANAVVITWDTDEPTATRVVYDATSRASAPDSYSNSTTQDNTLTRVHVATVSGLTAQTTYYYRVRSSDANGNAASSTEQSVETASERDIVTVYVVSGGGGGDSSNKKDETAPAISGIEMADIGAFEATIKFTTDELAIAVLEYGETNSYGLVSATRDYGTSHSVMLKGLKMGTDYHFKIKAIDKSANYSNSSDETFKTKYFTEIVKDLKELVDLENLYSFQKAIEQSIESVAPSIIPPFIEEPRVSDITENSAVVRWKTNIKAYPLVSYASEDEYDVEETNPYAAEVSDLNNKSDNHEISLTGLLPNTKYHFMVKSYVLPQAVGKSDNMTFVTKAPKIKPRVADIDKDAIRIVWTTAELSSSIVEYRNLRTGEINRKIREEKIVEHDIKIENLIPDTSYEIKAMGYNEKGNLVETGEPIIAKTSKDIFPPVISNLKIDGALVPGRADRVQMVVSWRTDEPATSVIEYEEGSGGADDELSARIADTDTFVQNHTIIITTLKPGSLYRVKVNSVDDAGNKAVLPVRTIITPRQAESIIDIVVKNFEDTFQFLKKIR